MAHKYSMAEIERWREDSEMLDDLENLECVDDLVILKNAESLEVSDNWKGERLGYGSLRHELSIVIGEKAIAKEAFQVMMNESRQHPI